MQPLDLALSYTAQGWPVFPCRPADEDVIDPATGELSIRYAKSPYTSNGLRGATRLERIIRRWWNDTPSAMVGVPTGEPIGAWVLDIDVPGAGHPEDGRLWLAEMEALHGALPATRIAHTAGGGTHYFWKHKHGVRNRGAMAPGVDTRGDGGYIVAPGSLTSDGRAYVWDNDLPIVDAPDWLIDLVMPRTLTSTAIQPFTYQTGTNDHYVNKAVDDELASLASTSQGGRGSQLNTSAFSLGTMVGAGGLARSEAENGLYAAAQSNGLLAKDGERAVLATIRRGLDAGIRNPRNIPESDHDNTQLVDITRMLANASRKRDELPQQEPSAANDPQNHESPSGDSRLEQAAANDNDSLLQDGSPITATAFKWIDPSTLPRREFAFGTHYIRKYVSVTVAPGGLGKTANSIADVLSMTSGRSLCGIKPPQNLNVWLFNAEDPRDEMERRIMAACIHYSLKPSDLEGRLFLDTGREQELVVAKEDKRTGVRLQEPIIEAVCRQILDNNIDVMIVDPFVSTHGVNENDNGAIDKVAKLWAQIADYTNCAIDIVHHLRKVADREATVEDARGAVSLIGAARSVRVLNRMSQEQAVEAGIEPNERFGMFAITYGKSNLSKLSHKADWRKIESVPLGNGRGLSKPQDHAPVVTEWRWPSAEDVAGELSADNLEHLRSEVNNVHYKESARAKNWVGRAVALALGIDIEDERNKRRCASIVKALLKEGVLHKVQEHDPVRREIGEFVRAG